MIRYLQQSSAHGGPGRIQQPMPRCPVRRMRPRRSWRRLLTLGALVVLPSGVATTAEAAEITFGPGIGSGMVLQRDRPVSLSGTATPDAMLTVTIASASHTVKANADGRWSAIVPAMPAGGPHTLTASDGGQQTKLDDVWVGDVWLASGQSNMQMGAAESIGGPETIASLSRRRAVRFLEMPRGGADAPATELKAAWTRGSTESLARFSAVACHFAEHLLRDGSLADIPLGLINSSFGGTSIEAWSPAASLSDVPKEQLSGSMFGIPPGSLYNGMIHPLTSHPIKGVLWYQGEANAGRPAIYVKLLRNMMEQWRKSWGQPDLPFLIVQLPAFDGTMGGLDFGWLREAQDTACAGFPHAWTAVTYDTTDGFDLHPKEKEEIGRRLALIASREVYGLDVNAHGPRLKRAEPVGDAIVLTFDQELTTREGKAPLGFAIAGENGDSRFATATLKGDSVTLESANVSRPATVRYAWGGLTNANLVGTNGLPAFPFRTDDAPPDSITFQPMPAFYKIETPAYQLETGNNGRIASLVIRGKQFLSNEPPGGTAVPGGFGFRNLALTTVLGPQRLTLSDGAVALEVACQEKTMTWTLTNNGNDPVDIHINLAHSVKPSANGKQATLSRDDVVVQLKGIDRLEGRKIIATAPPHASHTLEFLLEKP